MIRMEAMNKVVFIFTLLILVLLPVFCFSSPEDDIYALAEVHGGLVIHIGCGDGRLTADLRVNESYLVHGLDTNKQDVLKAREYIRSRGLSGKVRMDAFNGCNLPFTDGIVNLVVVENLGNVRHEEIMRVLAPGGVVCLKKKQGWRKITKPLLSEADEWTHFLHGPDNNAVARDKVVGPPFHIQWVSPPRHARSHDALSMVNVAVSAGGRIFFITDEGPIALPKYLPSRWTLFARDAYSGVFLWKRSLPQWQPHNARSRHHAPADLYRRLVAVKDRVFVTLSILGLVSALDPATGRTVRAYAGTEMTEEIIYRDGVLYLVMGTMAPEEVNRALLAMGRTMPQQNRIAAIDAQTGKMLWLVENQDTVGIMPQTLAAADEKVFFQNAKNIVCLGAESGEIKWRFNRPVSYARYGYSAPTLVVYKDVVLNADDRQFELRRAKDKEASIYKSGLIALNAKTGKKLWESKCGQGQGAPVDVFVVDDTVWIGENAKRMACDYRIGRDIHTGKITKSFTQTEGWANWHHHRCYRDKATTRYILAGRTGVEYCDLNSGDILPHTWVRGICKFGVLPCNGLTYLPSDQCACYVESKPSDGFYALAPRRKNEIFHTKSQKTLRLERGPAYEKLRTQNSKLKINRDWPTYRYDNARSSFTSSEISLPLESKWETRLGGRLSSMVSVAGRVCLAGIDSGIVYCLDGATGNVLWEYVAGGSVDSPPTLAEGLALFGCCDGWVYALRASDGVLAWRFRAAPIDRRIVYYDQVESLYPVHGSVLVHKGKVYCAAGRTSYLDEGVYMYELDLLTGKKLKEKNFYSRDPKTGKQHNLYEPYKSKFNPHRELPGILPDVVSMDGNYLFMRAVAFGLDLSIKEENPTHLFSSVGFLDDSWWERGYWIYGEHMWGGAQALRLAKARFPCARIMAFDDEFVYGYKDITFRSGDGLFASSKKPELKQFPQRSWLQATEVVNRWEKDIPFFVSAILLTGDTLFAAGPVEYNVQKIGDYLDKVKTDKYELSGELKDALASYQGGKGSQLWAMNKDTGRKLAEQRLDSKPVFDGMIAADGRIYIATVDGSVICWSK